MATATVKGQIVFSNEEGKKTTQSINHLNPDATDVNIAGFLKELSNLQKHEIQEFRRVESRTVVE